MTLTGDHFTPFFSSHFPAGQSAAYYCGAAAMHGSVAARKVAESMRCPGSLVSSCYEVAAREHARLAARAGFLALSVGGGR